MDVDKNKDTDKNNDENKKIFKWEYLLLFVAFVFPIIISFLQVFLIKIYHNLIFILMLENVF